MRVKSLNNGPHHLYRHFDANGKLLYVGISLSAIIRLAQHKSCSVWFDKIARVEIEFLPTRTAAVSAERLAIQNEKPKHNVFGMPDMKPKPPRAPSTFTLDKINPDELYEFTEAGQFLKLKSHELIELICGGKIKFTKVKVVDRVIKFKGKQILDHVERNRQLGNHIRLVTNG
jgi:hypothetical protein